MDREEAKSVAQKILDKYKEQFDLHAFSAAHAIKPTLDNFYQLLDTGTIKSHFSSALKHAIIDALVLRKDDEESIGRAISMLHFEAKVVINQAGLTFDLKFNFSGGKIDFQSDIE